MDEAKVGYGPRKLGKKAWAEQEAKKAAKSRQATVYGNRKLGRRNVTSAAAPNTGGGDERPNPFLDEKGQRISISQLEQLIEKDPVLLDQAIETELSHSDKPRKGAIEVLRKAENGRAGGPRSSVNQLLDELEKRLG